MITETIAFFATGLMLVSYIPQIARGYKRKSLDDLSMAFLAMIAVTLACWITYGILKSDFVFTLSNSIIISMVFILMGMKSYYSQRDLASWK